MRILTDISSVVSFERTNSNRAMPFHRAKNLIVVAMPLIVRKDSAVGAAAAQALPLSSFAAVTAAGAPTSTTLTRQANASPGRSHATKCQAVPKSTYRDGTITVSRRPRPSVASSISSLLGKKKKKKKRRTDENYPTDTSNQDDALVELNMYYRIYNPNFLHDENKAPLLVLHGGPSLPSQYLYSIAESVPNDRAIVFYDQIGCGRSSEPRQLEFYGIPQSIDDLETLIDKLELGPFHLLGHSYGGVLAYEYAKRIVERGSDSSNTESSSARCISIVLANTSTNIKKGNREWDRLFMECAADTSLPGATPNDRFFRRNQCRLSEIPQQLSDARNHSGKVWFGTNVVSDWVAEVISPEPKQRLPPFMLITGEYDFVTQFCTTKWKELLGDSLVQEKMMEDCSHYVHLEKPTLFGSIIEQFCSGNDGREEGR